MIKLSHNRRRVYEEEYFKDFNIKDISSICVNIITITTNVYAKSQTTRLSVSFRANEQVNNADRGKVQYSLNDGATWIDVTANMDNVEIAVTGDNLRLKIVPNKNYSVDYAGIVLRQDEDEVGGLSGVGLETGYSVPSNVLAVNLEQVEFGIPGAPQIDENNVTSKVEVHVRGSELEYDNPWSEDACDFIFGINTVYDEANNTITFKTDSFSTYAIATIDDAKKQTYTVSDEAGNEIIFKELPERNFTFTMLDYLKITAEELEVLTEGQVSKEAYDALLQMIKDSVKDEGETLAFYEIMVTTTLENGEDYNVEKGPLTIKLKATDTLKKYKNLYLIYLDMDDQNNITKGEKVKLTLSEDGKYYVGTLPHLSKWVLAGNNNIEKDESNPKTGDKLVSYISLLGISTFGLIYLRKKKLEDRKSI